MCHACSEDRPTEGAARMVGCQLIMGLDQTRTHHYIRRSGRVSNYSLQSLTRLPSHNQLGMQTVTTTLLVLSALPFAVRGGHARQRSTTKVLGFRKLLNGTTCTYICMRG